MVSSNLSYLTNYWLMELQVNDYYNWEINRRGLFYLHLNIHTEDDHIWYSVNWK
jgi:hypothetical protein